MIHEQKKVQINFCFKEVFIEETQKEISNLNNKKTSQNSDIPTKVIKENSNIFEKVMPGDITGTDSGLVKSVEMTNFFLQ